jgi:hypothetical protein
LKTDSAWFDWRKGIGGVLYCTGNINVRRYIFFKSREYLATGSEKTRHEYKNKNKSSEVLF